LINEKEGARSFSLRTRWQLHADCKKLYQDAYDKVRTAAN
jgi:hypothetical protein